MPVQQCNVHHRASNSGSYSTHIQSPCVLSVQKEDRLVYSPVATSSSSLQQHRFGSRCRPQGGGVCAFVKNHPWFCGWAAVSSLIAVLLLIDPLFNQPSGLITPSLFTGKPCGHGEAKPCAYDYEGSWRIGSVQGTSPLDLQISDKSVISCSTIGNRTAASYVAEPSLVIPQNDPGGKWYSFYQVKNLARGKGEIGVASSIDRGKTWQHLGIVLTAKYSISSPWVAFDETSDQWVMIPDTHKARHHSVVIYTTSRQDFPFGWKSYKPIIHGEHFMDTNAVFHKGLWWIFTTVKEHFCWGERSYNLRLYTATNLTDEWTHHPMSPITGDLRYARSGGRPFVYQGQIHRWTQDDSDYFGESLHLFKATILDESTYMEAYVRSVGPSGNGNWYSARTHHADVQAIPEYITVNGTAVATGNTTWFGLIDGDQFKDGRHHFYQHEAFFVRMKHAVLKYDVLQLLLGVCVYLILLTGGRLAGWIRNTAWYKSRCKGQSAACRLWNTIGHMFETITPELQLILLVALSVFASMAVFATLPQLFWCPRALIKVDVLPTPPVTHVDTKAPYKLDDLVIVTGATASFFDRLSNMIGSVHVWEPDQKVVVYDLGFSQSQLAKMMCWENVEVRRFPYEKYPEHVMDVRNYAFKTLVLKEALLTNSAVLWIDSGLELRADMATMKSQLIQHGHVSAMQEDNIGDPMYTYTKHMAKFYGMEDQWSTIKNWQFCAGGLQGFVRGSDAEKLVLDPVVNCSLHKEECIAPAGSSRKNHNFDQTALTLMIWANNFSCLPRETHCMWSVKKASRDPLELSEPIEVISRGHRLPKPYTHYIKHRQACVPDKSKVPWPALGLEHQESLSRYNLAFRISRIYLQPIGDFAVQCFSCIGAHVVILVLYQALLFCAWMGRMFPALETAWNESRGRMAAHVLLGPLIVAALQFAAFMLTSRIR